MPAFPFERRQNVLCMFFIVNFVLFNVDIVLLNLMLVVILLANLTLCCSFILMAISQPMKREGCRISQEKLCKA